MRAISLAMLLLIIGGCATAQHTLTPTEELQMRTRCGLRDNEAITPQLHIAACTKLIQAGNKTPSDLFSAFIWRGQAYRDKGDNTRAIQDFDQAIHLKSDEWVAYNNRGYSYEMEGEYDRAIQDYDQAIRLDPDDWGALHMRCRTRAHANEELETALYDCKESLRLGPGLDDGGTLISRGLVYFRMGDYDNAISDFDSRLKHDPKSADALYLRGLAKRMRHDTAGGDGDIAAAKAIDPKVAAQYARYGVKP